MKNESIHYTHDVIVYVPCFQNNTGTSSNFQYSLSDASHDLDEILSQNPDYILKLKLTGVFDAKTQPFDREIEEYNFGKLNL